jgi:hypothetical protein
MSDEEGTEDGDAGGAQVLDREGFEVRMRELLERGPLYSPVTFLCGDRAVTGKVVNPKSLQEFCWRCAQRSVWTFEGEGEPKSTAPAPAKIGRVGGQFVTKPDESKEHLPAVLLSYFCANCHRTRRVYWVEVVWGGRDWYDHPGLILSESEGGQLDNERWVRIRKLGQSPPPSTVPPSNLLKRLPAPAAEFLRKGYTALAHGFGLGAAAYLRRVVEESNRALLVVVERAAKQDGDEAVLAKVKAAQESQHEADRLQLIADALPRRLRPGGVNPLARLFKVTSEHLHGRTDAQSLALATEIKELVEWVFDQVWSELDAAEKLTADLQKLGGREKVSE